jgi:hypothetical protein
VSSRLKITSTRVERVALAASASAWATIGAIRALSSGLPSAALSIAARARGCTSFRRSSIPPIAVRSSAAHCREARQTIAWALTWPRTSAVAGTWANAATAR